MRRLLQLPLRLHERKRRAVLQNPLFLQVLRVAGWSGLVLLSGGWPMGGCGIQTGVRTGVWLVGLKGGWKIGVWIVLLIGVLTLV